MLHLINTQILPNFCARHEENNENNEQREHEEKHEQRSRAFPMETKDEIAYIREFMAKYEEDCFIMKSFFHSKRVGVYSNIIVSHSQSNIIVT